MGANYWAVDFFSNFICQVIIVYTGQPSDEGCWDIHVLMFNENVERQTMTLSFNYAWKQTQKIWLLHLFKKNPKIFCYSSA